MKRVIEKMGKKWYLKLMRYSFPERKKRALETYTMEMETLEKMSARELNFEYVHAKAAYEQQKNRVGIFGIILTMSVIMGVWKELFSVIARGLYNWGMYQNREVELIGLVLFFVIFGVLVMTVLIGILLYKSMKKARNLYKRILMLEEAQKRTC